MEELAIYAKATRCKDREIVTVQRLAGHEKTDGVD